MLSYRHGFHAGNFADVLKHTVQVAVLEHLKTKDKPFCYHDTHAGAGLYNLTSEQARKTAEYQDGIGKLYNAALQPGLLARYVALVREANQNGELRVYPGSPAIAAMLARPIDTLQLTELHPADFEVLQRNYGARPTTRIFRQDATDGLKAMLPPAVRRGLVLIDPSYELTREYRDIVKALTLAHQRFANGIYALWYPVIARQPTESFIKRVVATGIRDILRIEFCPRADSDGLGMTGSGMLVINPPHTLKDNMALALPEISRWLAPETTASHRLEQLVPE